ncbi:thiolase family protein [Natronomonas marina]|uniref:thiolase family protein n=1 Tax=Natronomonas marina TaxID=2961939 RepID=UPI0020C9E157|nr:thiolase family protein [Natronomonas marina]
MDARGDEHIFPVVRAALTDAGLERDDIDTVVNCGHDAYDGATISSGMKACPSGGYEKPTVRIQNGGLYSIHQAVAQIYADKADVVVVSSEDSVETDPAAVSTISQESLYHQDLGVNYLQTFGMLAEQHLENHDVTEEDYARVAEKNYRAAANNPHAHRDEPHSVEDVLDSSKVVSRLRELEVAPDSKGAAALVLASEDVAGDDAYAWVEGSGLSSSRTRVHSLDDRVSGSALRAAAQRAYDRAGIDAPREQVDAVELFNPVAPMEILGYEALGLCEEGEGGQLLRDGVTDVDGDVPVNASGGALATNPLNTGGLLRAIEAIRLLEDDSDMVDTDIDTAVATDSDCTLGEFGRTDAVLVVGGGD